MARMFSDNTRDDYYSWDRNPYYNPEKCDVTLLVTIDEPNMWYEFNKTIIVKDNPTGEIYAASDSGCSCPTPFENIYGLNQMTHLRNMRDFDEFFNQKNHRVERYSPSDILSARRKVAEILPDYC